MQQVCLVYVAQHAIAGLDEMVDQHRHSVNQLQDLRSRPRYTFYTVNKQGPVHICNDVYRWGSLANERALLDLLENNQTRLQPTALTLAPVNANIYARRHSAHSCPATEEPVAKVSISFLEISLYARYAKIEKSFFLWKLHPNLQLKVCCVFVLL